MIKNIVIVGGGTAGWMTAAALVKHLPVDCRIRLVESDQIATVGVGEATIPVIRQFNAVLGLDEVEFMRETNATFKLSIRFENWGQLGDVYNHAFGYFGLPIDNISFHHYWRMLQLNGYEPPIHDFNVPSVACDKLRFAHRQYDEKSFASRYFYAFQFDASLYAQYLRKWSEARGVIRTEGKVERVNQNAETGFIESITIDRGETIGGELFIDCSGFRGVMINQTLGIGFLDWSHWLPCNRAWAVSTAYPSKDSPIPPYTRARALTAGWQWRIPLQNRTGDGNVFCNDFISEEQGLEQLLANIDGEPMNEPRLLKFITGKREKLWHKNCVAIGLSGGFLEPLESTSIALIQASILVLMRNFPDENFDPIREQEYNLRMEQKYEESRNFLTLHYHATRRDDTEFWNYCRTMSIPEELQYRIDLFRHSGVVGHGQSDLFQEHNWLAVLYGQGITPQRYDPRLDGLDAAGLEEPVEKIRAEIVQAVADMPSHNQTLAEYCAGDLIGQAGS
jgi:tryptophan halogenase